jgi:hypothetical protein
MELVEGFGIRMHGCVIGCCPTFRLRAPQRALRPQVKVRLRGGNIKSARALAQRE